MQPPPSVSATNVSPHPSCPLVQYHQEVVELQAWAREQLEAGSVPAYVIEDVVTERLGYSCDLNEFVQRRFWY